VLFAWPNRDPLEEALYQSIYAPDEEAFSTTVPVPQREAAVPDGLAGTVLMVTATEAWRLSQPAAEVVTA
jgi:hypothetical protein